MNVKKTVALILVLSLAMFGLTACKQKETALHVSTKKQYEEALSEYTAMAAKVDELGENASDEMKEELKKLDDEWKVLQEKAADEAMKKHKEDELKKISADLADIRSRISNLAALTVADLKDDVQDAGNAIVNEAKELYDDAVAGYEKLMAKTEEVVDDIGEDIQKEVQKVGNELKALGEKIANSEIVTQAEEDLEKMKDEVIKLKDQIVLLADKVEDAL